MRPSRALRQVLLTRSDGWWVAEVLSLPGCISQGRTREEAITNAREAIALMLDTLYEQGDAVPDDTLDAALMVVAT